MLLHKESSPALGNAWWETMAFSKPKEFMKYELTFPHFSIGKGIPFLLMCKHLIREYLTLSSYELQKFFLSVSLWAETSFTEGQKQRGTRQGGSEEEHMFASVWSLKGASPQLPETGHLSAARSLSDAVLMPWSGCLLLDLLRCRMSAVKCPLWILWPDAECSYVLEMREHS